MQSAIAPIKAIMPITTHVNGLAKRAAVNAHVFAISPGNAVTAVIMAAFAIENKPNVKDFDKGAVDTDLTMEDLIIDKEAKLKEKQGKNNTEETVNNEIEEDVDDLI